ncbi:hypothetical protein [Nocardia mangyaensis]|uniref:hypothetical protein n=1 Tax=Nocardia mangyaensis TaxID=2213200 RepID=UPI002675B0E5|nr:hypothetical protein [Nocardia mangyaensis]MDO3648202.1 hypothetical protein [Nocardia mangyaensis]
MLGTGARPASPVVAADEDAGAGLDAGAAVCCGVAVPAGTRVAAAPESGAVGDPAACADGEGKTPAMFSGAGLEGFDGAVDWATGAASLAASSEFNDPDPLCVDADSAVSP